MIQFKQVSKFYQDNCIFNNFNLELPENKITCILGESGVGKTTLLNMIADLTNYEGSIIFEGSVSYIFQEPRLLPNLTVQENLRFVQPLISEDELEKILILFQIQAKKDCYPKTLSGGEAQRVSIARAFIVDAPIILMDEPFSSLDLSVKYKLIHFFTNLWLENKKTVIFVTHDVDEALMLADEILLLKHGTINKRYIIREGYPRAIKNFQQMRIQIIKDITEE